MPLERDAIASALLRKGFREQKHGDHDRYWLFVAEEQQSIHTKLSRGTQYRTIDDSLLSKIALQLMLVKKELVLLVACTIEAPDYIALLRSRGVQLVTPAPAKRPPLPPKRKK